MTYTVHFKSGKYGLDEQINQLEFLSDSDRDEYIEKIANEISRLGLTWVPEFSEVQGPVDLDTGMTDKTYTETPPDFPGAFSKERRSLPFLSWK